MSQVVGEPSEATSEPADRTDELPAAPHPAALLTDAFATDLGRRIIGDIHRRGDRITSGLIALHATLALALAPLHDTWRAALAVIAVAAVGFWLLAWRLPGRFVTRSAAGVALLAFCALHIHQTAGLAETHFFFFTSVTAMILYKDWRAIWPGVIAFVVQQALFAWLHQRGWRPGGVPYFEPGADERTRLLVFATLSVAHAAIASYCAEVLRRRTLRDASHRADLQQANAQLRGQAAELEQVNHQLAASESRLRRIGESGLVGLAYWTLDGGFTDANDAFLQMLGQSRAALAAGKLDWRSMTPPEWRAADAQAVRELATFGVATPFEKEYYRADGTRVPVLLSIATFAEDRTRGLMIVQDLRVQKTAAARTAVLQEITAALARTMSAHEVSEVVVHRAFHALDAVMGVLVGLTPDGTMLDLLGAANVPDDLLGLWRMYPLTRRMPTTDSVRTGQPVALESAREIIMRYPELAGAYTRLGGQAAYAVPLRVDDRAVGALLFVWRTARQFSEGDRSFLGAIADQCAQALERARLFREAQAASEAKSSFLATVSHELRTPLNAIIGYTELLLLGIPAPLPQEAVRHLQRARTAARHLLSLINEVLAFTRVEAGSEVARLGPVRCDMLLEEVASVVEPLAREKGVRFESVLEMGDEQPPIVWSDAGKLRQILINLLGNAVKFTPAGTVRVRLTLHGDDLVCEVSDTGIGIAPEHHRRIFDPFWQVGQASGATRPAGTGLGLAVTKHLVTLLGGEITLDSAPGVGTTFTVRLPGARMVPTRPARPHAAGEPSAPTS